MNCTKFDRFDILFFIILGLMYFAIVDINYVKKYLTINNSVHWSVMVFHFFTILLIICGFLKVLKFSRLKYWLVGYVISLVVHFAIVLSIILYVNRLP